MDLAWCHPGIRPHLAAYLARLQARQYSVKTLCAYSQALKPFCAFLVESGAERLPDVTVAHLEQYRLRLVRRNLARATAYGYLRIIRGFFQYLEQAQAIFVNPARALDLPKYERRLLTVPTEEEVKRLLAQPDVSTPRGIRDRAMLEMFYATGARLEELARMNLAAVDRTQGAIRVMGKGRKERMLPLGRHARHWLDTYLRDARPRFSRRDPDEPALWVGRYGRRLQRENIQVLLRHYAQQAALRPLISPHALRRACATHMLRRGAHPVQIQMLLGHATLENLSHYLRVTMTDLHKAYARSNPAR